MTLDLRPDRHYIRAAARSTRFLVARLTAPEAPRRPGRLPVNVALVLDRSGSMGGQKIRLAKEAVDRAIATLDQRDRFSVVFYDDRIDVVVPSRTATSDAREAAREALRAVDARGSTNLFEGWLRGCEQVAAHLDPETVSRTLLLTDGLANVGVTDRFELETHAGELRRRGVATSTLGVGHDFDEALLEAMATAGGGNFYYVETASQIGDLMTSELGEALEVVARDVTLELVVPYGAQVEMVGPEHAAQRGPDTWSVSLGDLVSRQEREVVLRINFPYGTPGDVARVSVAVRDRDGAFATAGASVEWTYADHLTNDQQPRTHDVDRLVGRLYAARARLEAVAYNKSGDYRHATAALGAVAGRIRGYADGDQQLLSLAEELDSQARHEFARPMAAPALKRMHSNESYLQRARNTDGRARRSS